MKSKKPVKKEGKTEKALRVQTTTQRAKHSVDIEKILNKDMKKLIDFCINKYGLLINNKIGMDRDDLLNDVRFQIWKGLSTFKANKKIQLTTYLSNIITYRFKTLANKSNKKKHLSYVFMSSVESVIDDSKTTEATENSPDFLIQRQQYLDKISMYLKDNEKLVYYDLRLGHNLTEMAKKHNTSISRIIAIVNKINKLAERKFKND